MPRRPKAATESVVENEPLIQYSAKDLFARLEKKMDDMFKELHEKTAVAETKLLEARLENLEKDATAWKSFDDLQKRLQKIERCIDSDETREEIKRNSSQTKFQWWGIFIAGITALAAILIPFFKH